MTTTEYRDQLIKKYNETVAMLQRVEGAISACDELLKSQEGPTEEEPTDD